jgi:hypothetical protein
MALMSGSHFSPSATPESQANPIFPARPINYTAARTQNPTINQLIAGATSHDYKNQVFCFRLSARSRNRRGVWRAETLMLTLAHNDTGLGETRFSIGTIFSCWRHKQVPDHEVLSISRVMASSTAARRALGGSSWSRKWSWNHEIMDPGLLSVWHAARSKKPN